MPESILGLPALTFFCLAGLVVLIAVIAIMRARNK